MIGWGFPDQVPWASVRQFSSRAFSWGCCLRSLQLVVTRKLPCHMPVTAHILYMYRPLITHILPAHKRLVLPAHEQLYC